MLLALLPLTLAAPLPHGGTYVPPVPPPWHDGVLPRNPAPGAPGSGPSYPPGGLPTAPGPGVGPQTPGNGVPSVEALSWRHWWRMSGDRWLDVKGHVHSLHTATGSDTFYLGRGTRELFPGDLRPTAAEIDGEVVPALLVELGSGHRDRVTAALIALGKIGPRDGDAAAFLSALQGHLDDPNQEVAETAALALGLAGHPGAEGTLLDLALDRSRGRTLVGAREVPLRTRAFAAYGLGLLAAAQDDLALDEVVAVLTIATLDARGDALSLVQSELLTLLQVGEEVDLVQAEG